MIVPEGGLEPPRLIQPTDFKSVMSTNSITRAHMLRRRPDSNRRMAVLQTDPLDHLGTTPYKFLLKYRKPKLGFFIYKSIKQI